MSARSRMCHGLALALAAGLVLALAGCGGSQANDEGDRAGVGGDGTAGKAGRLAEVPEPLRLADLRRERQGTARSVVLRLFYFAQWGSAPNIAAAYDPGVRNRVGVSNIVGTYSQQRGALSTSRLRIVESTETQAGMSISLEILRADAPPARHSYSLRRRLGRWQVVHDTVLEEGLSTYVAATHSQTAAGDPPDRAAARQGRQAAHAYRRLFASDLDR